VGAALPDHIVYVHGAGEQENPILLKRRLDELLFGGPQGDRTRLAYYSDQGHRVTEVPAGLEAMPRPDPFRLATDPRTPREEVARALAASPRPGSGAEDNRVALAEALLARADAIEPPRVPVGGLEGLGFWDPGFRLLVGILARDVIRYLFDGQADAMREPLQQALASLEHPTLLIAHSLGTIVAFDVLSDPAYVGPAEIRLVTLGSPLGIANVQERLRDGAPQPHPVPPAVVAWHNLADARDPVASGQPLTDEYEPHGRIEDDFSVENPSLLHHDLVEYLRSSPVRAAIGID
jgi:hypothetical protein